MTKTMAKRFLHTWLAIIALLPFAEAGSGAETLDQLCEKAKLEKWVAFYSGGPAAPAKEFMQKYPGITVSVTGGFSNVLNERIEKQSRSSRSTWPSSRPCRISSPGRSRASSSLS